MQYLSHLHYSRLREKGFILCAQWRMPSNEMQVIFIYSQLMTDKSDSIVPVPGKEATNLPQKHFSLRKLFSKNSASTVKRCLQGDKHLIFP